MDRELRFAWNGDTTVADEVVGEAARWISYARCGLRSDFRGPHDAGRDHAAVQESNQNS